MIMMLRKSMFQLNAMGTNVAVLSDLITLKVFGKDASRDATDAGLAGLANVRANASTLI